MDKSEPSGYYEGGIREMFEGRERLRLIAKALKDYVARGKSTSDFEEEYGCKIIMDRTCIGIKDVRFHNSSNETMFMLKYNK